MLIPTMAKKVKRTLANPVYLDCAATTPVESAVLNEMFRVWTETPGNSGSRTHEYGLKANKVVQKAREQVASVVQCEPAEVYFTSGATESNNIAILGLSSAGLSNNRRHIVSTAIEHKAVLEPLQKLEERGFEVTLVLPESTGMVSADSIFRSLRPDTFLVSVMQVNNETGVCQPIEEIAGMLTDHDAYLHVDAAQGFGKDIESLHSKRIDLISISAHKIFGPMGAGCLVSRRRNYKRVPLAPLIYGGGQEAGVRSGTLAVPLIAGLGMAAELAEVNHNQRKERCLALRSKLVNLLESFNVTFIGEQKFVLPHILSFSIDGVDSEALMISLKDIAAISNGAACTSQSYESSHVLKAMGVPEHVLYGAVRLSWCHLTPELDWECFTNGLSRLL